MSDCDRFVEIPPDLSLRNQAYATGTGGGT
jgi:hypothetical protein